MKQNSLPSLLLGSRNGSVDPDADLLTRFVADRDQSAFAELVHRYARLVWRVARTRCRNDATAEDVFQAAFVVLSRKASSIRSGDALAGWLHRTAHRLAVKATQKERPVDPLPTQLSTFADPLDALSARELLAAVDDELAKLSDAERSVLVLCGIDGLANDEAAKWLGTSTGSVKGRLERARAKLRTRLDARGLVLPTLVLGLIGNIPPASAVQAALKIPCLGPVSYAIEQLISEGLTMKLTITKAGAMLALCAVIATVGGWSGEVASQPKVNAAPVPKEVRKTTEAWGEVRDGLQAGLRMPGGTTVAPGETEELQVVVRNVSKKPITIAFDKESGVIHAIAVKTDNRVELNWTTGALCSAVGYLPPTMILEPGEELIRWTTLVSHSLPMKVEFGKSIVDLPAGKYQFQMPAIGGNLHSGRRLKDLPVFDNLGTGTLEVTLPEAKPVKIRAPVPKDSSKAVVWSEPVKVDWKGSSVHRINGVWAPDGKSVLVPAPTLNEQGKAIAGGGVDFRNALTGKVTSSPGKYSSNEANSPTSFQAKSIDISPDGKTIIALGMTYRFNENTEPSPIQLVWTDAPEAGRATASSAEWIAFSTKDNNRVTTSQPDGRMITSEIVPHKELANCKIGLEVESRYTAAVYHSSGKYYIFANASGVVFTFDAGKVIGNRICYVDVRVVAGSPNGKMVAVGGEPGSDGHSLAVLDDCNAKDLGQKFRYFPDAVPAKQWINGLAFSADSKHIAAACSDGVLRIFDVKTGKLAASTKEHQEEIFSVAYSPDGKKLLTVGRDAMKMWDVDRLMAAK